MTDLTLPTPECFKTLAQASRYKAAFGGRGSGKSWHFASMVVEHCLTNPGSKVVCIRWRWLRVVVAAITRSRIL